MNLGDYLPTPPIDDRRRPRATLPMEDYPTRQQDYPQRAPASLLDMMANQWGVMRSMSTPARGLADQAGYNLVGRSPMPIAPARTPWSSPSSPGYSGNPGDYPLIAGFRY